MIILIAETSIKKNKNLAIPNSLLSIALTNGEEYTGTFNAIFNNYFQLKAGA